LTVLSLEAYKERIASETLIFFCHRQKRAYLIHISAGLSSAHEGINDCRDVKLL